MNLNEYWFIINNTIFIVLFFFAFSSSTFWIFLLRIFNSSAFSLLLTLRAVPSVINKFWFNLSPLLTFTSNIWSKEKMVFSMLSHCTLKPDSWLSKYVSCSCVSSFFSFFLMFSEWILYLCQVLLNERTIFWSITSVCGWTWCTFIWSLITVIILVQLKNQIIIIKPHSTEAWPWARTSATCMTFDSSGYFSWTLICHQNKDHLVVEFSCWRCWICHCWSPFL